MRTTHTLVALLLGVTLTAADEPLLPLNSLDGVRETWGQPGADRKLDVLHAADDTTDGNGAIRLTATSVTAEGNHYFGVMVQLPEPIDLRQRRVMFDARSSNPDTTRALYVRFYNTDQTEPAWSFNSWSGQLAQQWRTFSLQHALCPEGLSWEANVVGDRSASAVSRIEFIIGTHDDAANLDIVIDNLRTAAKIGTLSDLLTPKALIRETVLVDRGQPAALVLHPDSDAGEQAAAVITHAVHALTGVNLPARPGTADDRRPEQTTVLIGDIDTNPALLLLYARYLTPVDSVCPGQEGALIHTVSDPFGLGFNALIVGASDAVGLAQAAAIAAEQILSQPKGQSLQLPRLFEARYSEDFRKRFRWLTLEPKPDHIEKGLERGRSVLERGGHTSIAGELRRVAQRYQLSGHSADAQLYVKLWELYAGSAVADPRKFGGPWGFDSDFPSGEVVAGWDVIEEDPALSDEDRLRTTTLLGKWLAEAVIPSCVGAARSTHVPHNHQTFPGLGALFAGLYFSQGYDVVEGRAWLGIADAMFSRQATYFKPYEDCNGYQWLTNGHLMRYALARPDFTLFENGNAQRIIDYCIGTMDNLGYQVPYGDTGTWKCWNSEMICLDMFAYATGTRAAAWAAALKRRIKNTHELYAFYRRNEGELPAGRFDGVAVWPLEPQYYASFPADPRPPFEQCFDKITFREAMDPNAPYLLLDGLSNGGHKHLDGNSLPRLTQYARIWLADNDYYKSPIKYHNSMMSFRDGESGAIPAYVELLGVGETDRYGYSRTRLTDYAGVDWERTVLWLKWLHAFVVLDRLTARQTDDYQFRILWHGVGTPTLTDAGMLLEQKGPAMWVQLAPGPKLSLVNDTELGKNWGGYPYADPVVRSLSATASVRMRQGESYLFASLLHGSATGPPASPWDSAFIAGTDGLVITTDAGKVGVGLGPFAGQTDQGFFRTDADAIVADAAGLSLLGATQATLDDKPLHASQDRTSVDIPAEEPAATLEHVQLRPPTPTLSPGADAPRHPVLWEQRPTPEKLVLTGNRGLPGAVELGTKLQSKPEPAAHNAFSADSPNTVQALVDGDWTSNTNTSVMYDPDQTVALTFDFGQTCQLQTLRWMQWWATTSSKQTSYLLGQGTVAISNDGFDDDVRSVGVVTDDASHEDWGTPLEYQLDLAGATARYLRLEIEPQPGAAVYLSEVLIEGRPEAGAVDVAPYHFTRLAVGQLQGPKVLPNVIAATREGTVLALKHDGSPLWRHAFTAAINDLAVADLDGDGNEDVIVGRQDYKLTVLDHTGAERWTRELSYYRRPPYVNVVRAGDLDGDGTPEVIAGGENWRFYAFAADGTELWNYESVHPSRSGAVADLDGDGKAEVMCGTHYYWLSTLNQDGTRRWRHGFGPICYDIATGSFDGDATRGVVLGGGDGCVHYLGHDGKLRLKYNTGDEVKAVATGDLDGDGRDELLAGSMSHNVYCFGADAQRRWRTELSAPVVLLAVAKQQGGARVVATTSAGTVASLDSSGAIVALTDIGTAVTDAIPHDGAVIIATANGRLLRLQVQP